MEEKQRVYIKGDPKRGDEVIKLLEDLGGKNTYRYNGEDDNIYYYIAPNGVIRIVTYTYEVLPFIEEFYKEIKLPKKWKPEFRERYYYVNSAGIVMDSFWFNSDGDTLLYEYGNCYRTKEEAEAARDKIKNFLNNDK